MTRVPGASRDSEAVKRALLLITEAMDLLDAHNGPPEAAAHLDLAQQILRKVGPEPSLEHEA